MKSSVKRRLQIRFVLLALAALVILQGLIVSFSIFRNYQQITGKADYIIRLTSTAPDSPEAAGSAPLYVIAALRYVLPATLTDSV